MWKTHNLLTRTRIFVIILGKRQSGKTTLYKQLSQDIAQHRMLETNGESVYDVETRLDTLRVEPDCETMFIQAQDLSCIPEPYGQACSCVFYTSRPLPRDAVILDKMKSSSSLSGVTEVIDAMARPFHMNMNRVLFPKAWRRGFFNS